MARGSSTKKKGGYGKKAAMPKSARAAKLRGARKPKAPPFAGLAAGGTPPVGMA